MMLSEIAQAVQGELIGEDIAIVSVSIDTRTLQGGQLYVAIKGKNFDGNQFIQQAELAGASAAIVHSGFPVNIPHIVVGDTHLALAELAGAWRQKYAGQDATGKPGSVVGVTGSNGKTTAKEMIAAMLSVNGRVLFTQGNLNNDIGVPLTLLRLNESYHYAVIEMGANHPGEIEFSSRYAQADVVVITNAGAAHIEGFGSLDGVARTKGEIIQTLKNDGCAVINRDDNYFDYWRSVAGARKTVSFGLNKAADVSAGAIKTEIRMNQDFKVDKSGTPSAEFLTTFEVSTALAKESITLKLAGHHNVMNALAAIAVGLGLGLNLTQIKQGLGNVKPVTGRLQPLVGRNGNMIIDDTYNANSASLKAALEVLKNCAREPWLILGAFGELGPESPKMHEEMGEMIKSSGVVRLLATGSDARNTVKAFGKGATFFESQMDLIDNLKQELKGNEILLIKGSRAQRMENVAAALVENYRN
jgi:UDP-N-acetylmuramoyl-tripeptide--D-alanyl-D-alanine ligase